MNLQDSRILAGWFRSGASLAEATLLVPFWQEMSPTAFYDWYAQNHARLVKFYSPLQILSAAGAALWGQVAGLTSVPTSIVCAAITPWT